MSVPDRIFLFWDGGLGYKNLSCLIRGLDLMRQWAAVFILAGDRRREHQPARFLLTRREQTLKFLEAAYPEQTPRLIFLQNEPAAERTSCRTNRSSISSTSIRAIGPWCIKWLAPAL
jgi:hypothetical protein